MLTNLLVAFFFGGIVGLDTTAAWQVLFSHPLISCALLGAAYSQPQLGLFFGIIFELIWFHDLPVGGARFPEGNVGSFLGLMLMLTFMGRPGVQESWLLLLVILLTVIISYLFGLTIVLMRKNNIVLIRWADRYAAEGNARRVGQMHVLGVLHAYVHGAFWSLIFYLSGFFVLKAVLGQLHGLPELNVEEIQAIMLGVGMAVMIRLFFSKKRVWHLFLGLVCGVILAWVF